MDDRSVTFVVEEWDNLTHQFHPLWTGARFDTLPEARARENYFQRLGRNVRVVKETLTRQVM
jgi:hypothetical protein